MDDQPPSSGLQSTIVREAEEKSVQPDTGPHQFNEKPGLFPQDEELSLERIRLCLVAAGFDHIPAYSVLRDAEDNGGADGLRRVARTIREDHGGIYRTAAKLWTLQRNHWQCFPTDPIPRRIRRIRDGEVRYVFHYITLTWRQQALTLGPQIVRSKDAALTLGKGCRI